MRFSRLLVCVAAAMACSESQAPTDGGLHIVAVESAPLKGTPYDTIPAGLAARVTDAAGRPVAGLPLIWTTPDGGKFAPGRKSFVTDSDGVGRALWVLGPAIGTQHASATVAVGAAEPASFSAEADGFRAVSLSMGTGGHCALDSQSRVWCWGRNADGELGNGSTTPSKIPVLATLTAPAAQLVTGEGFTCALTVDGDVYCWGRNTSGELGQGTTTGQSTVPLKVPLPAGPYRQIAANFEGACAVSTGGDAYCWGGDEFGRFGSGGPRQSHRSAPTPALVVGGFSWQQLSLGDDRACGVRTDRTVYCWGWNSVDSPLGIAVDTPVTTPMPVNTVFLMDSVTVSGYHECGVTLLHVTYCWGANLNIPIPSDSVRFRSPAQLPSTPAFQAVHSIHKPTYALGEDGKAYWWGPPMNATGGLPQFPTVFSGNLSLRAIGTGNADLCAIAAGTGVVYCWTDFGWDGPLGVYGVPAPNSGAD